MDPLTHLYARLRQHGVGADSLVMGEPPRLEDWLAYWNDDDTDIGNLRNFEHWLSRQRPPGIAPSPGPQAALG